MIAASDSQGTALNRNGLDVEALIAHKAEHGSVRDFPGAETLDRDMIVDIECEIWIPAARPDVITLANVDRLKAKLVVAGANIPIALDAERVLSQRGVLVVPDFIANAGGVICAATEYQGGTEGAAFAAIEEKIEANTEAVLADARSNDVTPREAAMAMAERRVRRAMGLRRWH